MCSEVCHRTFCNQLFNVRYQLTRLTRLDLSGRMLAAADTTLISSCTEEQELTSVERRQLSSRVWKGKLVNQDSNPRSQLTLGCSGVPQLLLMLKLWQWRLRYAGVAGSGSHPSEDPRTTVPNCTVSQVHSTCNNVELGLCHLFRSREQPMYGRGRDVHPTQRVG